jgi:hypothetical protein
MEPLGSLPSGWAGFAGQLSFWLKLLKRVRAVREGIAGAARTDAMRADKTAKFFILRCGLLCSCESVVVDTMSED